MATKVASRADVKAAAKNLSEGFIACRDVGHTWRQFRVVRVRGGYNRDLFCPTCKTNRHEFISRTGEKLSTGYTYPDGYQFKGMGRVQGDGRNVLRLESVVRVLDKAIQAGNVEGADAAYDAVSGDPQVEAVPNIRTRVFDQEAADSA